MPDIFKMFVIHFVKKELFTINVTYLTIDVHGPMKNAVSYLSVGILYNDVWKKSPHKNFPVI